MSVSSMTVGGKIKFKIVLLGDQFVGKSSVIERFINNRFEQSYNATIGIDFLIRNLVHNNRTYRLQIWDTAGQQRFRSLIPSYLKDSNCGLIVYDLSNEQSLENVQNWLDFYKQNKQPQSVCILVGNKSDIEIAQHSCKQEVINEKVEKFQIPHYKISAKTGEAIQELFGAVIDHINEALKKQINQLIVEKKEQEEGAGTTSTVFASQPIKLEEEKQEEGEKKRRCC